MEDIQALLHETNQVIITQRERNRAKLELEQELSETNKLFLDTTRKMDAYVRAATLLGNVSDESIKNTLNIIQQVVNKALRIMFPESPREIVIEPSMYNDVHPHIDVSLVVDESRELQSFEQSGSGLGEIVSFLFTVCLIDIIGGRKVMVCDEILNGVHPEAKFILRDLLIALSKKFQFFMTEYNLDVGEQFELVKKGTVTTISKYDRGSYYFDKALEMRRKQSDDWKDVESQVTEYFVGRD